MKYWRMILAMLLGLLLISTANALLLPFGLTDLDSFQGWHYLHESQYKTPYANLMHNYVTQFDDYCGITSTVIVLNSLQPTAHITQKTIFSNAVEKIVTPDQVRRHGVGMEQLVRIFHLFNVKTHFFYGHQLSITRLRQMLKTELAKPKHYLIAQYSRIALKQNGIGHLSPIAAYDQKSDRVLIADTASFNYPPTWVKLPDLLHAMRYHSNYRGLLLAYL